MHEAIDKARDYLNYSMICLERNMYDKDKEALPALIKMSEAYQILKSILLTIDKDNK